MLSFLVCIAVLLFSERSSASNGCPFEGPVYLPPKNLDSDAAWKSFTSELAANLTSYAEANQSPYGPLYSNESSFSIHIVSSEASQPIFDFHYTSPAIDNTLNGTSKVTADTVYRIASISKLLTTYSWLLHGGTAIFGEHVTKYLPQLAKYSSQGNNLDQLRWDEVTLGALASHLAGTARDYYLGDIAFEGLPLVAYGLPPLSPDELPTCDPTSANCTADGYLAGLNTAHPIFPTFHTPAYSNAGFNVLGLALESKCNSSYSDILEESFLKKLNMSRTSTTKPQDSWGVIPSADSMWDYNMGLETPAGGVYSSSADLAKLGLAILKNQQLSARETREWMKPVTHVDSLYTSIGRPWEIYRFVAEDSPNHIVTAYTKAGDIGSYHTWLVFLPDYNVVATIMVAGNYLTQALLRQIIMAPLLPALLDAARQQAAQNLAATYNSTTIESSITLIADEGPGLAVTSLISNGTNLLAVIDALGLADLSAGSIRAYPSTLVAKVSSTNKDVVQRFGYRLVFPTAPSDPSWLPALSACSAWGAADNTVYGNIGIDEMVIGVDKDGKGLEVELRALRVVLERT